MSLILFLMLGVTTGTAIAETRPDHELFTQILKAYVREGVVDYGRMKNDARLAAYVNELSLVNPDSVYNRNGRLAFWINLYNATTLKLICDNYPIESISELHAGGLIIGTVFKSTAWDRKIVNVNGEQLTLNDVEHEIIRAQFKDPRVHFALVCASKSCPQLRSDAFEGALLDEQLDNQARKFLADPFRNEFSLPTQIASISKIFKWYESDFAGSEEELLIYLSGFLSGRVRESILAHAADWSVEYRDYDWSLNGF